KLGIHPLAYRYLVLQTHYRQKLTFSWESLFGAYKALQGIWGDVLTQSVGIKTSMSYTEFEEAFKSAINEDLNTSKALAIIHKLLKSSLDWGKKNKLIEMVDSVLGLGLSKNSLKRIDSKYLGIRFNRITIENIHDPELRHYVELLDKARERKDWETSDK